MVPDEYVLTVPHPSRGNQPDHFIINFPGYVRNEDKALATFGGPDGLAEQRGRHPKHLQLRFRPADPYCHPITSDEVNPTSALVVKLTRPRAAVSSTPLSSGTAGITPSGVKAELVAAVDTSYTFSSPADMQYVGRDLRARGSQHVNGDVRRDDHPLGVPPTPLLCGPPNFMVEGELEYSFKGYKAEEHGIRSLGRKTKRASAVTTVDFFAEQVPLAISAAEAGGKVSELPAVGGNGNGNGAGKTTSSPAAVEKVADVPKGTQVQVQENAHAVHFAGEQQQQQQQQQQQKQQQPEPFAVKAAALQELLTRLEGVLAERPVYLDAALATALRDRGDASSASVYKDGESGPASLYAPMAMMHPSSLSSTRAQHDALSMLGYKFRNGPWKGAWIRRGYDPRKDPEARKFQILEYTLPYNWYKRLSRHRSNTLLPGGGGGAGGGGTASTMPANTSNDAATKGATNDAATTAKLGMPPTAQDYHGLCSFAGVPKSLSTPLQLCDIQDLWVKQALQDSSNVAPSVNDACGWLKQSTWEEMKSHVAARYAELLDGAAGHDAGHDAGAPAPETVDPRFPSDTAMGSMGTREHQERGGGGGFEDGVVPASVLQQLQAMLLGGGAGGGGVTASTPTTGAFFASPPKNAAVAGGVPGYAGGSSIEGDVPMTSPTLPGEDLPGGVIAGEDIVADNVALHHYRHHRHALGEQGAVGVQGTSDSGDNDDDDDDDELEMEGGREGDEEDGDEEDEEEDDGELDGN